MAGRHVEMGARGQDSMGMKKNSSFFSFFFLYQDKFKCWNY